MINETKINNMEKKNLIGRKVRGFGLDNIEYYLDAAWRSNLGKIGTIEGVYGDTVKVNFEGDYWYYPADQIEQHLVEDTPSQYEVGMTVYDWAYGKGIIKGIDKEADGHERYPIEVYFSDVVEGCNHKVYTLTGKYYVIDNSPSLSLTPYDLVNGGATFPTFKPKLPKIEKGTLVYVKYNALSCWEMRYFSHFDKDGNIICFDAQEKTGSVSEYGEYSLTNPLIEEKQ